MTAIRRSMDTRWLVHERIDYGYIEVDVDQSVILFGKHFRLFTRCCKHDALKQRAC
jgi:hypothetical protein